MNRRTLLCWLGLAPAVAAAANSGLSTSGAAPRASGLIWTQHGCYLCAECGTALMFNDLIEYRAVHPKPTYAIGTCTCYKCPKVGTRYKVPLTYERVEIVKE